MHELFADLDADPSARGTPAFVGDQWRLMEGPDGPFHIEAAGELPYSWKYAGRGWGHPLHKLAPYVGGFPAQLARFFILNLSDPDQVVLDPWSGGGTTALEAVLCNREAVAADAFEYAYVLSHAKSNPISYAEFDAFLRAKLAEAADVDNADWRLLDNPDTRVSFSDHTLDQILRLRAIVRDDESREGLFLKAVIAGILHGPSRMFLSAPQKDQTSSTTQYVKKYLAEHGIVPPDRDIYTCAMNKARRSLYCTLPRRGARVVRSDCRTLPLGDESVNLVVTSPPYMSVLSYPWNNWLRLWWLGRDRLAESARLVQTSREDAYRRFMSESLAELYRVMIPNSAAVIVVGDVGRKTKCGMTCLNSALLIAEEAVNVGFDVDRIIDDVYKLNARSMLVQNMLKWGYTENEHADKSSVLIDRCLVLAKGTIAWRRPHIYWQQIKRDKLFRTG